MEKILIADIGTTNLKAGVVSDRGKVLSYFEEEIELHRPEKGAVEHNPQQLYSIFKRVCRRAVSGFEDKISLIVLSAYQCGLVLLDGNLKPLCGIVTLMDSRSENASEDLKENYDVKEIYNKTGCPPFFGYSLPKILWLREKKPKVFSKAKYLLGSKDYIIYCLTGQICTEPSIAAATQMFNVHSLSWDKDMLNIAGIEEKNLPRVVPGDRILGEISPKAREELGLKRKVSILPGVYDGGMIAIGLGGFRENVGIINLGTTAMLRVFCSAPLLDKKDLKLQSYYLCADKWLSGGAVNNAGIPLRWLKDNIFGSKGKKNIYNLMFSLAQKISPGSDKLFFLPFLTGERDPRIGNLASGVLFGLKDYHQKAHLIRSSLEGTAYSLRFIKEALGENGVKIKEIRIGGGGSKSLLWIHILSDVMNLPARVMKSGYTPLLGGAILGYTALGEYKNLEEAADVILKLGEPIKPMSKNVKLYNKHFGFFSSLLDKINKIYSVHARL